jgi:hypothetical protein
MKYDVNKINIKLFTQQVWWLHDKGIEFHPWAPLGSNDQTSQMTFIMVNNGILIKRFLTYLVYLC